MKTIRPELIRQRKRRIRQRLEHSARHDRGRPMLAGANLRYELAEKAGGTAYGGLAAIHAYAVKIGLPHRIDNALHLFKKTLSRSTIAIEKQIKKLQEIGVIRRVGPDKGGRWKVLKQI